MCLGHVSIHIKTNQKGFCQSREASEPHLNLAFSTASSPDPAPALSSADGPLGFSALNQSSLLFVFNTILG